MHAVCCGRGKLVLGIALFMIGSFKFFVQLKKTFIPMHWRAQSSAFVEVPQVIAIPTSGCFTV